jgi:hypothetical protein
MARASNPIRPIPIRFDLIRRRTLQCKVYYVAAPFCKWIDESLKPGIARTERIEAKPPAPRDWDWFCLDRIPYHGRMLTIVWDRTARKSGRGKGFRLVQL